MKKIILVVLLLSALSGCQLGKPKIEKQLYQMQDQSVSLTVQLGKHAEVKQLKMKMMYSSKGWMKQQNMTLDEAEQALNEQFNRRQDLILALQERGSLCNACEIELESDQAIGSSFTDVVHENKTPHVLYEETVLIDLQKIKEFDHDILAVFSEYISQLQSRIPPMFFIWMHCLPILLSRFLMHCIMVQCQKQRKMAHL